eukprot:9488536-Pyramimonas_sp.AAC.1
METSDGTSDIRSTTGTQMGFTTAPRVFINTYNKEVEGWRMGERARGEHRWFFTSDPRHPDLPPIDTQLSVFMDDITKSTVIEEGATAAKVTEILNSSTSRLEGCLAKGQWTLNPSKTNHLLDLRGARHYQTTRRLRR